MGYPTQFSRCPSAVALDDNPLKEHMQPAKLPPSPLLAPAQEVCSMSSNSMPTPRTRVVRESDRGVYDRDTINRILTKGFSVTSASRGRPALRSQPPTDATETCSTSRFRRKSLLRNLIALSRSASRLAARSGANARLQSPMNYRSVSFSERQPHQQSRREGRASP